MNNQPAHLRHVPPLATMLLLATSLLVACTPIHGDDPSALPSRIEQPPDPMYAEEVEQARPLVRAFVVEENLPGLSLAVAVDGEIVWAEGFGWADINEQRPVTPRTRFRIGSVAMPMTATAVGILHERGLLDLDAPVQDYVPSFPDKQWPVTTRQLMAHVAGVRRYGDDEEALYRRHHCDTALDGLQLFADDPLRFEPGTHYQYSIYGWSLVGAVVEAAAGEPFLDFVRREVFEPLQMQATGLDDPAGPATERTSFYWPRVARDPSLFGVEGAIREGAENTCTQGAGALLSTPTDLVRFGLATLDGSLLRPETLLTLQTPLAIGSEETTGHGLGWFTREVSIGTATKTSTAYGHGGSSAGGTTSLVTLPEQGMVIAITTNVSFATGVAADHELGGGLRPFFPASSLARVLADTFAETSRRLRTLRRGP